MYKFRLIMLGLLLSSPQASWSYVSFDITNRSGEPIRVYPLYSVGDGEGSNHCGEANVKIENNSAASVSPCSTEVQEGWVGTIEIYRYDKETKEYRYCKDYSGSSGDVGVTFTQQDCSWL